MVEKTRPRGRDNAVISRAIVTALGISVGTALLPSSGLHANPLGDVSKCYTPNKEAQELINISEANPPTAELKLQYFAERKWLKGKIDVSFELSCEVYRLARDHAAEVHEKASESGKIGDYKSAADAYMHVLYITTQITNNYIGLDDGVANVYRSELKAIISQMERLNATTQPLRP